MNTFNKYLTLILSFCFVLIGIPTFAQTAPAQNIEMADQLREHGKIYVVVGVLIIILTGVMIFLIMTDRKLSRIEKQMKA